MTESVRTVLWFNGRGHEAATFYCSLIPNSRIESQFTTEQGGPDGNQPFSLIDFSLAGAAYQILDAGPMFPLSECVSILVETSDQAETDRLWAALVDGGGSHGPCGWLKDRFGLSWQIVPSAVSRLLLAPETSARALAALMTMGKIDLAAIESAAAA